MPQADGQSHDAACDHDWRDIDGRWLCIECRAEKPYASDAAYLYESEADAVIARETDAVIKAARRVVEQPFNHIQHEDLIALREALDAYE